MSEDTAPYRTEIIDEKNPAAEIYVKLGRLKEMSKDPDSSMLVQEIIDSLLKAKIYPF